MQNRVEPADGGMRERRYRGRYLLAALAIALVVGLGAAVPVLAQDEDGSIHPQVVGGDPVPNGKYPFMTSIQADTSNRGGYQEHYCGGTLIDRNSVLTAAHCVEFIGRNTNGNTLGYRDVRLVVGVTVLSTDQGQVRRIDRLSDIDIHPNFSKRTLRYDAAVIKLSRPVKRIAPIKLAEVPVGPDNLETPGNLATVTGWGSTQPSPGPPPRYPKRMQKADPPLVSDADCETSYGPDFYPRQMVCAGNTDIDTCQGDSGGPMFVEDSAGVRRQIGITSWGFGCAALGSPGVYAEVNAEAIHDFIVRMANH